MRACHALGHNLGNCFERLRKTKKKLHQCTGISEQILQRNLPIMLFYVLGKFFLWNWCVDLIMASETNRESSRDARNQPVTLFINPHTSGASGLLLVLWMSWHWGLPHTGNRTRIFVSWKEYVGIESSDSISCVGSLVSSRHFELKCG